MEYFDKWTCQTCNDETEYPNRREAIEHMKLVHGFQEGILAKKSLVMHLDFARGCYQSNYNWDFGKFKMLQMVGRR